MKAQALAPETERKNVSLPQCTAYAGTLKRMVDCKTVFTRDFANQGEFDRFYQVLAESFPLLTARAERLTFGAAALPMWYGAERHTKYYAHVPPRCSGWWGWLGYGSLLCCGERRCPLRPRYNRHQDPSLCQLQACEELLQDGYDFNGINLYIRFLQQRGSLWRRHGAGSEVLQG